MLQKMYSDKIELVRGGGAQGEYADGMKSKKLDLQFYQRALRKNKWPIALFTAFITATAIFYSLVASPIYAANATLLLESQKANIVSIEDLFSSEQESIDYYGTQIAILKSRALAERVIRQLEIRENLSREQLSEKLAPSTSQRLFELFQPIGAGLGRVLTKIGFGGSSVETAEQENSMADTTEIESTAVLADLYTERKLNELIKQFRQSLSIKPVAKTKLVTIVYESTDPRFSAMVANMVAYEYIENASERRNALKDEVSLWMGGRIAELKSKLDESEEALLLFKKTNGLIELDGSVDRLNEQEILIASTELSEARSELSVAQDLYRKIQAFRESAPQYLETLPIVQADLLVRSVTTELGGVERDLSELKNRYGFKHPKVIDAESQLVSLRATLNSHIERVLASFDNDYQLLQKRVLSLQNNILQTKENIQVIGQQKITLETLEREVAANRDQYNNLFDRITETQTTEGLNEANAVVAEPAWIPTKSVKPKKLIIVSLALLGSLLLAAAISFFTEFLDDTVNSTEDIQSRLKMRLLGVIPLVKDGLLRGKNTAPLSPSGLINTSENFIEAVNTCRTALSISSDRDLTVILVTSTVPNEGKSTVALNLAYSFGQLERTLLIDCDLRRPSIAKALDMPMVSVGLSNILSQDSTADKFVKRSVLDSFDCLTSGPVPDNPLEMLSSPEFAEILDKLRHYYDKIIIDSPPTHVVSDALVLSRLSDGVVYVVKPHDTSIKLIDSCLKRLAEARASIVGVCLSQVDVDSSKSYGGFELYGFGVDYHGYGNYYGDSLKQKHKKKHRKLKKLQSLEPLEKRSRWRLKNEFSKLMSL